MKLKKALRISIMSATVCFGLTFSLIIINAFMGIFISLSYYFKLFGLLTIGSSLCLIAIDAKRIFTKSKVKKVIKSSDVSRSNHQHNRHTRRKIS